MAFNQPTDISGWVTDSMGIHAAGWGAYSYAYGYLWWINEYGYAAMGDGGNTIYVNTKKNVISAVSTSCGLSAFLHWQNKKMKKQLDCKPYLYLNITMKKVIL